MVPSINRANRENRVPHQPPVSPRNANRLPRIPEYTHGGRQPCFGLDRWRNANRAAARPPPAGCRPPRPVIHTTPTEANPHHYRDWFVRTPELKAAPTETGFKYTGKIDHLGWEQDGVPIKLEWYPPTVHVRSKHKYLAKDREYTIGRDPSCDISFHNDDTMEELRGISAAHLKLKIEFKTKGKDNLVYLSVKDTSKFGTYVNDERCPAGLYVPLNPKYYINLVKSDDERVRPNVGFRVVLATRPPKFEDTYVWGPKLGEGSFGEVYKVRHVKTNEIFAAKKQLTMLGEKSNQDSEREIRILRTVAHENIIKFKDAFEVPLPDHKIERTLIMEFVPSGSLLDVLVEKGFLPEPTAQHILRQLVEALGYMQEVHNMVHRDLKPANILMCDRSQMPRIKLADFGLAKVENLMSENTICGTKAYLPPPYNTGFHPQAVGMNWASDSYALGVITYQILTGRLLGDGKVRRRRGTMADPLVQRGCSELADDFIRRLTCEHSYERMTPLAAKVHSWLSGDAYDDYSFSQPLPKFYQPTPPTQLLQQGLDRATIHFANPSVARRPSSQRQPVQTTQRPSSSSSSSSSEFSASSPPSSASSEDEITIKPVIRAPPPSFVSDRMSICAETEKIVVVGKNETSTLKNTTAFQSTMEVETQRGGLKPWCILCPLKGNMRGHSTIYLEKESIKCGSNVPEVDLIYYHPKVRPIQAIISRGYWDDSLGRTATIQVVGMDKLIRFSDKSKIFIYDDGKDYIGYKVCFTEAEKTTTIVRQMNRLNMGPIRTNQPRQRSPFTPYSCASWNSKRSNPVTDVMTDHALTATQSSKKADKSKQMDIRQSAWGKLISKNPGFPDIPLFAVSTGLGEIVDFVDSSTAERETTCSCRIYRRDDGVCGIHAIRPVAVGDKYIYEGEFEHLIPGQSFSLYADDGSVLNEYKIQIYK